MLLVLLMVLLGSICEQNWHCGLLQALAPVLMLLLSSLSLQVRCFRLADCKQEDVMGNILTFQDSVAELKVPL